MKKLIFILTIVMMVVGLAACAQQQNDEKEKTNVTGQKEVKDTNKGIEKENNNQEAKDNSTETQNTPASNVPTEQVYQNEIFKDVNVTVFRDEFIVTGKAQVFEGNFQYALYNGEKVLIENNYQTEGAPAWGEFKITFQKELVTSNDVKLELFDYSAKDGSKVNTLEIPIPKPE